MKYSVLLLIFLAGCAIMAPEKQAYLDATQHFPLSFHIAKDSTETAWKRALLFVTMYGKKITAANDTLIQTREPDELMGEYGYTVSFKKLSDSTTIKVNCTATSMRFVSLDKNAETNAHIAARYIMTGYKPYPELIYTTQY